MEVRQIELLIKVMKNYPVELGEILEVIDSFVSRGWVFAFGEGDDCVFEVTDENRKILMDMIQEPEQIEKICFHAYIRDLVHACLGLYGVFRLEELEKIHRRLSVGEEETGSFMEDAAEVLHELEKQRLFWMDNGYIVSLHFQTQSEYRELLEVQGGCDYYIPNENTVFLFARGNGVEKSPEYEAVHRCLARELRDAAMAEDMLEELSGYIVTEDWGIPQLMNRLYQWDVAFDNPKLVEKFTRVLSEWIYSVRRWSERGYSRKERGKENEETQYLYTEKAKPVRTVAAKVYPNDPCPCGSGKKYKKCCGR